MTDSDRVKYLRIALVVLGLIFISGSCGRPVGPGPRANQNTCK